MSSSLRVVSSSFHSSKSLLNYIIILAAMGKPEAIDVAKSDAVHEEIAPAPSNEATHDPGADSSSDEGGPEKMTRAKWLACIALGLGYTTAFQQLACTGTILRPIDQELGHTPHYNWMMASYTLCSAVFLPLSGTVRHATWCFVR